jgi:hypothetical protein
MFNHYRNAVKNSLAAVQNNLAKSTAVAIILVSLINILFPFNCTAAPGDETTVGTLTLTPSIEAISVISAFSGDNNANNQATLYYKERSSGTWKPGIPMTVDRRDTLELCLTGSIPNTYKNQWRAVIFWLTPNTSYDVRVDYTDPDGGSGSVQNSITTRDDDPPSAGSAYYVATDGNDNPTGGSLENPWRTINYAAGKVSPGDTVRIMPGTYNEVVNLSKSGTANNYITFRSQDPNNQAVVRGTSRGTFTLSDISYVRLKELTITADENRASCVYIVGPNSNGNIIEDCNLTSVGVDYWAGGVIITGEHFSSGPSDTIVQRNDITTSAIGGNGPFGVSLVSTGGGTVIRDNTITGGYYDGIGGGHNFQVNGGPYQNTFIYRNNVSGSQDDGIEAEGGGINCAVWGNTIKSNGNMCIATAPVIVGPMYIFRNVATGNTQAAVKLGSSSYGFLYYYHNTFYSIANSGFALYGTDTIIANAVFRNNIMQVSRGSQYIVEEGGAGLGQMDFDYNSFYSPRSTCVKWAGTQMTWSAWKSTYNRETHGVFGQENFVNAANDDVHLKADAIGIDRGVVLPGFNDVNSPWPSRGSAPDMGAYEWDSGVPSPPVPPTTSPTATPTPTPSATNPPPTTPAPTPEPIPASFTLSGLVVTPNEIKPSENINISALVTNNGGGEGSYAVILKINNKEEARKEVILQAGESNIVTFLVTEETPGNYGVNVNGIVGQFKVTLLPTTPAEPSRTLPAQPSTNRWLIGGIVAAGIIIIGLLIYIVASHQRA